MSLSVVSALTRLGVDPWEEAARLSALPRTTAALTLRQMIDRLAGDVSLIGDAPATAARLIKLLPKPGSRPADIEGPMAPARAHQPQLVLGRLKLRRLTALQIGLIAALGALVLYSLVTDHGAPGSEGSAPLSSISAP